MSQGKDLFALHFFKKNLFTGITFIRINYFEPRSFYKNYKNCESQNSYFELKISQTPGSKYLIKPNLVQI